MAIAIPNSAIDAGLPFSDSDTVTVPAGLLGGYYPELVAEIESFGASLTLAAFTVVGKVTSGGAIVKSVQSASDGSQDPIGILVSAVTTGSGESADAPVYKSGNFNMDALVWDASWNTDALKRDAFKTNAPLIFVTKVATAD